MPDKIALITGCSNGFGLLTSVELAKTGYQVVATMHDLSRRARLDQAVAAAGVTDKIDVRALDVTHFPDIAAFVDTIVRDYGRIDVLVNNAGLPWRDSPRTSRWKSCGHSSRRTSSAPSR